MTSDSIWSVLRASDDPADVLAGAILAGAWFPPNPRDTDERGADVSGAPHCEHCQPESSRAPSALEWILRSVPEQYREDAAQALHDVGVPIEDLPADLRADVRAFTSHHYSGKPK